MRRQASDKLIRHFLKDYERIPLDVACEFDINPSTDLAVWVDRDGSWQPIPTTNQVRRKWEAEVSKSGKSACRSLVVDLLGLRNAQYDRVLTELQNAHGNGLTGVYMAKSDAKPTFAIVMRLPPNALGVGAAAALAPAGVGALVGAAAGALTKHWWDNGKKPPSSVSSSVTASEPLGEDVEKASLPSDPLVASPQKPKLFDERQTEPIIRLQALNAVLRQQLKHEQEPRTQFEANADTYQRQLKSTKERMKKIQQEKTTELEDMADAFRRELASHKARINELQKLRPDAPQSLKFQPSSALLEDDDRAWVLAKSLELEIAEAKKVYLQHVDNPQKQSLLDLENNFHTLQRERNLLIKGKYFDTLRQELAQSFIDNKKKWESGEGIRDFMFWVEEALTANSRLKRERQNISQFNKNGRTLSGRLQKLQTQNERTQILDEFYNSLELFNSPEQP